MTVLKNAPHIKKKYNDSIKFSFKIVSGYPVPILFVWWLCFFFLSYFYFLSPQHFLISIHAKTNHELKEESP